MKQFKLKKIAAALALTGATLFGHAHAAGLGKLTVQSGLGQPLRAEIDLTSVSRDEAGSLAARLASPDAYRQAGVEYTASLLGVRMTVDRRPDGQYFVRLASNQPVNDPIVDALIELTWANGRLVREYTFLLDPIDMRPAQPQSPVAAPAPKAEPKPAPPRVEPAPKPAAVATPVRPAEPPKAAGITGSYEVKKGDTLGRIARQAQADGVSLDQMMIALQRVNQDAFVGGNINRLKSGVILNIPDKEAAAAVTPSDARRLVVAQSADWKAYQDKIAGGVQAAPVAKPDAPKQAAKGKITAKVEEKGAAAPGSDQLKLSKPDAAAMAKPGVKPKATEEDRVAKERELRDAKTRQAELEKNVKDLQKLAEVKNQNLADLQKQAQAKAVQPQVAQGPVAVPPPAPAKAPDAKVAAAPAPAAPVAAPAKAPEPPKAVEAPKATPPEPPKAAVAPAAPAKAPEAPKAAEPVKATEPVKAAEPAKVAETAKAAEAPKTAEAPKDVAAKSDSPKAAEAPKAADAPKAPEAPKAAAKAAPKAAPPPPAPKPEPSLVDEFLDNPAYLVGGGGVLALLGGYAAFAVRRKRKVASTGFENSIVTGGDLKANSVFGNTGGQSVDTGHSSFQSDFSQPGGAGGVSDADEVDPVAEADVYMAYGRDAQAEEILKEALQKDPSRQNVRLKLLEIYSQRGDAASFGATASELHAATDGQGEQWQKAAALGQQLDPANPLYGGTGAAAIAGGDSVSTVALGAGALAAAAAVGSSSADKTVTLAAYGSAGSAPVAADDPMTKTVALDSMKGNAPVAIDLDFDLGGDDSQQTAVAPELTLGNSKSGGAPAVDFDLGFGDPAPAASPAPALAPKPAASASIDTDFAPGGTVIIDTPVATDAIGGMLSNEKTQEITALKQRKPDAGMSIDFDFDLGSDSAPAAAPVAAPAASGGGGVDFDFGSLSLDLPAESASAVPDAPGDDVATKLDLAKAYQEMGDKDGARELLKEVLAEGSDAQKGEAQKLIAALG